MRVPVHLQREAARLHFYDQAQSNRAIARTSGLAPGTVNGLRRKLRASGRTWLDLQVLDDDAWCCALRTQDRSKVQIKPAPDWAWVQQQMQPWNASGASGGSSARKASPTRSSRRCTASGASDSTS